MKRAHFSKLLDWCLAFAFGFLAFRACIFIEKLFFLHTSSYKFDILLLEWIPILCVILVVKFQDILLRSTTLITKTVFVTICVLLLVLSFHITVRTVPAHFTSIEVESFYSTDIQPLEIELRLITNEKEGSEVMQMEESGEQYYISTKVAVGLLDLTDVSLGLKFPNGKYSIALFLKEDVRKAFYEFTSHNIGKKVGIILGDKLVGSLYIATADASGVIYVPVSVDQSEAETITKRIQKAFETYSN